MEDESHVVSIIELKVSSMRAADMTDSSHIQSGSVHST